MAIKNTFFSALLVGTMLSSAAIAADTVLSKEGDVTLTIRGNYTKRGKTNSDDAAFLKQVNKRAAYGGGLEANYYVTPNMSVLAGVDYQKFDSKDVNVIGAVGPKYGISSRYIPIRAGFLFHANNFSGFRPYIGGGYEFVRSRHKGILSDATANSVTVKGRHANGGYIQAGINYFSPDGGVGFNFDIRQSINDKKNSTVAINNIVLAPAAAIRTHTIKYNPLNIGLGVTIAANDN